VQLRKNLSCETSASGFNILPYELSAQDLLSLTEKGSHEIEEKQNKETIEEINELIKVLTGILDLLK